MNTTHLLEQANHNKAAGWSWFFLTPAEVCDLCHALQDSQARLERIGELAQAARLAWIDHDREEEHELLEEIERVADVESGS